jgi:hypothetical protein
MANKYTLKDLKDYAKSQGGECLSDKYTRANDFYLWKCNKCNYKWESTWTNLFISKKKRWCPRCSGHVVLWEDILESSKKANFKPLFKFSDYQKNSIKMPFQCLECGEISNKEYSSIQQGKTCDLCARKRRSQTRKSNTHDISELKEIAQNKGGDCLEKEYLGVDEKHWFICKKGHKWQTTAYNILKNISWCSVCSGRLPSEKLAEELKAIAEKRGGKLLSTKITNKAKKYKFKCNNQHPFFKTYSKLKAGQWCPECSSGLFERICRVAFEIIFNAKFAKDRPEWLLYENGRRLELDGYNKDLGIAFEHQGIYHFGHDQFKSHPELYKHVQKRDEFKANKCKEMGIRLFIIPELSTRLQISDLKDYILKEAEKLSVKIDDKFKKDDFKLDYEKAYIATDTLEMYKDVLEEHNYVIYSESYLGVDHNYDFECLIHNEFFNTTLFRASRGQGCQKCRSERIVNSNKKSGQYYSFKKFIKLVEANNFTFMFDKFDFSNLSVRYPFYCNRCGEIQEFSPKGLKMDGSGRGCINCNDLYEVKLGNNEYKYLTSLQIKTMKEINDFCKTKRGICNSEIYQNEKQKLAFECEEGHTWDAIWGNVKRGSWCPDCAAKLRGKSKVKSVEGLIQLKGGKYLGEVRRHNRLYRKIKCKRGHTFEISTSNLTRGGWCGECYRSRSKKKK